MWNQAKAVCADCVLLLGLACKSWPARGITCAFIVLLNIVGEWETQLR